jgi:hypothetical protein
MNYRAIIHWIWDSPICFTSRKNTVCLSFASTSPIFLIKAINCETGLESAFLLPNTGHDAAFLEGSVGFFELRVLAVWYLMPKPRSAVSSYPFNFWVHRAEHPGPLRGWRTREVGRIRRRNIFPAEAGLTRWKLPFPCRSSELRGGFSRVLGKGDARWCRGVNRCSHNTPADRTLRVC